MLASCAVSTQEKAKVEYQQLKESVTWYRSLWYKTLDSWSQFRRVAKVVYGPNSASSLPPSQHGGFLPVSSTLSITVPGRDGEPLQEQQLELFSARTSTQGNQLRLWFSSIAYVLMNALQQNCLATTELASTSGNHPHQATQTRRTLISVRRIQIAISTGCPFQTVFCYCL